MNNTLRTLMRPYFHVFSWIADVRLKARDLEPRIIHSHLVATHSTSILMWSYAIVALITINHPLPGIVGVAMSTIHILSPILFRFTRKHLFVTSVMIGSGFIHQTVFSYYTGGFMAVVPMWYAVLPLLAGIISGKRGALLWGALTFSMSALLLTGHLTGHPYPTLISSTGHLLETCLLQFGFIIISTIMTVVYMVLHKQQEEKLTEQKKKIDDLFKVLFHDLANPLGRIAIGLSIAKRQENDPNTDRGIDICLQAQESMLEITQNVRRMYSISQHRAQLMLGPTSINESIAFLVQYFDHELSSKKMEILFDRERHKHLKVLVEPVSFKNQVLANIVSNAIKFSNDGSKIRIEVSALKPPFYVLDISNEGPAIPSDKLANIFEGRKGFGLQIVKSFVELYEGSVGVKSNEKGTTVSLVLRGTGH